MLLAIDTSTRYAGVALLDHQGQIVQLVHWRSQRNHSVELLPTVQAVLSAEHTTIQEMAAVAVALGPGSFSALRVGLSIAKGFALAWELPLLGVTTLETEAFSYRTAGVPVVALLDAGRGELAWSIFAETDGEFRQTTPERISSPEELLQELPSPALLCGEGLEHHGPALAEAVAPISAQVRLVLPYLPGLRVSALAHLGYARMASGHTEVPATLQPLYLRHPTITPPKQPS